MNVLREPEKNNLKQTKLYMYKPKYVGAGLDQTKGYRGQQEHTPQLQHTDTGGEVEDMCYKR